MAAVTGLTVVKNFNYRGDPLEEFSNTYHFKSAPPGDDASWTVLMNDVVGYEKAIFTSGVKFVRAYGYDSDDDHAHHVFAHDFTIPGPPPTGIYPGSGGVRGSGDQASCVEWKTDKLNQRGKPIYLRKYFHEIWLNAGGGDLLDATYKQALTDFGGLNGIQKVHGGLRSLRQDLNVLAEVVIPYSTTRTLKRRGKRPPLAP